MSVYDWSSGIKITFDRPIVTEMLVPTSDVIIRMMSNITVTVSSDRWGYKSYLTDGITSNSFWFNSGSLGWVKIAYTEAVARHRFKLYSHSDARPNGYILEGSNNDVDWSAITSGNFANTTGWKELNFDVVSYRYWKLTITSKYSTDVKINEIELYGTKTLYSAVGWEVLSYEPTMSPNGTLVQNSHSIRKITRADDNYSVIIWLDLNDRLRHPQGEVLVRFNGIMQGPGEAFVAPFELLFTPQNITPIFNPQAQEYINIANILTPTINRKRIYYEDVESYELNAITIANCAILSAVRTHVDDIQG